MYHGLINVYKEAGYTSHDVVARLRGICKQKKIGHTGTLDPDAVGVLPVCLGNGTRLFDMLQDQKKEYVAVLRLGVVTDTQDLSGKILEERPVEATPEEVLRTVMSFAGESMQLPPMYSALKVKGKKLCDLARAGKEVERTPRPVTFYSLELLKQNHPEYTIRVECSKGTYIRTLCHDIGQRLGCGGAMASLQRTRVGEFGIDEAYTLDELEKLSQSGELERAVVPVEKMFERFPALRVKEEALNALKNGNQLREKDVVFAEGRLEERRLGENPFSLAEEGGAEETFSFAEGGMFRVYDGRDIFYGIYRYEGGRGMLLPVKMFLPEI